ncbi:phosphoribosyltransferase family protein [Actinopolymorpha sp. B11F2]|uniref:ComF family protein n=1 Tax=Actinopolymorpha sp. B11F2 TaxID=3160862 RepID=UPI0032E398E0
MTRAAGLGALVAGLVRDDAADLFLGSRCVGCTRPGRALCPACQRLLVRPAFPTAPDPAPTGLPPVWAVSAYDGVARSALLAHKERGRTSLAAPLGAALAGALSAAAALPAPVPTSLPVLIVPVPSGRAAVRTRGHDPLLRIVRRATGPGWLSGLYGRGPRVCRALEVVRTVADQGRLDAASRRANLAGAFEVKQRFRSVVAGRCVILVDDVVTTGTTLVEAANALRRAGAKVRSAAVVAATQRRGPMRPS